MRKMQKIKTMGIRTTVTEMWRMHKLEQLPSRWSAQELVYT
jgi:ABC-type protease/lipase transport system fused ATPase/permease subunit